MELKHRILELLENDARLSARMIATMLEISEEEVSVAIAEMEADKIIIGYSAVINWEKVGADEVTAMIDVKVVPEREVGFNAAAERIYRFPEVTNVYLMSGTYDLAVMVQGKSIKDVAQFVSHKLSTLEAVQSTTTHFILKRYKQNHFIFDEVEEDKRLVVSP